MTPTLYRDTGYTLTQIVDDITDGNIALPDIQRPFVWSSAKARDLFDSLYRGYPVGTLLLWETGAGVGTRPIGGGEADKVAKLLIVDGQQRITSLYAVVTGKPVLTKKFTEKRIRIAFRPEDGTFEVCDAAIQRDPQYIADITDLWKQGYRPTVRKFLARVDDARETPLKLDEKDRLEDRIDRVRDLQYFRFQVIELNVAADEEQVADIFVRINSEGVKLNQADFILTLMSVHWEKGRMQLEQFCRDAVDPKAGEPSPKNAFIDPSADQLLRAGVGLAFRRARLRHVYSILRGKDLETGEVSEGRRIEQFDALRRAQDEVLDITNWHEYLKCLLHAGYRSARMINSQVALIYTYVLWLIGRRDFGLGINELRAVISRWFFMSHTTGRYTGSPESAMDADLSRIAALKPGDGDAFIAELDRVIRSHFTGDYWKVSLPNRLDTSAARSPALFAYWAALNILDAELLFSDVPTRDLIDANAGSGRSIERQQLFPKAYLATKGFTKPRQTNAIANMAFVDWPYVGAIKSSEPLKYWPKLAGIIDRERLKRQKYLHALPVGWEQLDYPTFLERRRELIAGVIHDGFERLCDGSGPPDAPGGLEEILQGGESGTVEFKATARLNMHTGSVDKKMGHAICKTVCGFMNAEGGTLLIGVDDASNVIGIERDLSTLSKKSDRDGYELFLRQLLDTSLSVPTVGIVRIKFEPYRGAYVCVVSVSASGKPVFAKTYAQGTKPSEFWVRVGNATKQFHGNDMIDYQHDHWG